MKPDQVFTPEGQSPSRPSVALIIAPRVADRWPDDETPKLVGALLDIGIIAEAVPWYIDRDWSQYHCIVLRSAWDVYWSNERYASFIEWLDRVGKLSTVLNSPETVLWNLDKRHLKELIEHGVSVIPTQIVEIGNIPQWPDVPFVVKPATSAGALSTARYEPDDLRRAREHVEQLHRVGMGALIQPYVATIDIDGERCLAYYNGVFSHAIRKGAVLKPGEDRDATRASHPSPESYIPSQTELTLAQLALSVAPNPTDVLYARVDMVNSSQGPQIMELELIDPLFFFDISEGAVGRFAAAIKERCGLNTTPR